MTEPTAPPDDLTGAWQPEPVAAVNACDHLYTTDILGGHPLHVRACTLCRMPDWDDLMEQAVELYRWGWGEGAAGKPAREAISAYDKPREPADGPRGPRNARDVPEAAHSGSGEFAAHHRTLAAVARVHADAIRSLHHHANHQLDNHTARLLHVLDDELARVLTQLAETADALQPQPGGGYDGPSVQECAQADRAHWTQKYAGE